MQICANCDAEAAYFYMTSNSRSTPFCKAHAPRSVFHLLTPIDQSHKLAEQVRNVSKASAKKTKIATVDSSPEVAEDVELNSIDSEPTEEVANESEPGID